MNPILEEDARGSTAEIECFQVWSLLAKLKVSDPHSIGRLEPYRPIFFV